MAALQARNVLPLFSSSSPASLRPKSHPIAKRIAISSRLSLESASKKMVSIEEFMIKRDRQLERRKSDDSKSAPSVAAREEEEVDLVKAKLYALAEAAADRAEMHAIIGEQRSNWNALLLGSINAMTLTASVSAGLSAAMAGAAPNGHLAFKASSIALYSAATALSMIVNYLQPSQLAEEQRNASRLFRRLEKRIRTTVTLGNPCQADVEGAMERILSVDKAYPLALLGVMLEKFLEEVKPAVWWPSRGRQRGGVAGSNGWSAALEGEMEGLVGLLKRRDTAEYLRLSKVVLGFNKFLAISGPSLTAVAGVGAGFVGSSGAIGQWAAVVGVVAGALATVVNSLQHGGQVGMVFEMYRNCAGHYRQMEEEIESSLEEEDVGRRENGELFRMRMALKLGRSLSELGSVVGAPSARTNGDGEEFAGKLF